jgi:hypothetical protein
MHAASPIARGLARTPLRAGRALRSVLTLLCASALGCASTGPSPAELAAHHEALAQLLASAPAEATADSLVVRLAFDADADLDLYVTDSAHETVYFGNSPSGTGGELLADLRCDAPSPRVETVVFAQRRPGAVRVGVDAPERCRKRVRLVPFVVELRAGERRVLQRGAAVTGRFEVIVLEIEVDGAGSSRRDSQ